MDIVESIPDPSDGRARLVRLTDKGRQAIGQSQGVLSAIEREIERELGKARFEAVHDALSALEKSLERGSR